MQPNLNHGGGLVSCMCVNQLAAMMAQLKNLPLAMLMEMLGPLRTTALGVGRLSAAASAAMGISASASASASMSAAATLGFSASAMANLEALASLSRGMGLAPFGASAAASLNVAARSMNVGMPGLGALLSPLLGPVAAALAELLKLTSALSSLNNLTGFNLATPGIGASIATSASASARASASAAASAGLSANAALAMRLNAAAHALGINLTAPGGAARLNAALAIAASIQPPGFPMGGLGLLMGQTTALAQLKSLLGVDLLKKLAAAQLAAILGNINANVAAAFSAAATASASASASASAAANASAALAAAAGVNAKLLAGLPNLLPMSLAANVSANLALVTGINPFATGPCASCKMF
jgi:hypothetical protein